MDTDELIRAVGSPDFAKNLKALAEQEAAAKAERLALGKERGQIARRTEEQDLRDAELGRRERSVQAREASAVGRKTTLDERAKQLSRAETSVQKRERTAAQAESASGERMTRAEKLIESNEAEKSRLARRMAYLEKIPA